MANPMVPQRARIVEQGEQSLRTRSVRPNVPRPPRNPNEVEARSPVGIKNHNGERTRSREDRARTLACGMVLVGSGSAAMRFYNFAIVIEQEPEEDSPSLPDCCSNGRTTGEAKRNMGKVTPAACRRPARLRR